MKWRTGVGTLRHDGVAPILVPVRTSRLPMFPLEHPLLPGEVMPLRIFEPRYLAMLNALAAVAEPEIGVVLIARGGEVGGGDQRHDVGCVAAVVGAGVDVPPPHSVTVVGLRPIVVEQWLPDDPYPEAMVRQRDEPILDDASHWADVAGVAAQVHAIHRLLRKLGAELDGVDRRLPDDGVAAVWRLATLLPLGPFDRQQLLDAVSAGVRLERLCQLAAELQHDLELRLNQGG